MEKGSFHSRKNNVIPKVNVSIASGLTPKKVYCYH